VRLSAKRRRAAVNMGQLFVGFILIVIGLSLQDSVQTVVNTAKTNASAMVDTILDLIPLVWTLICVGAGVVLVYDQFKGMN
jgi:glycerol uptake facilitator-like aquaporin